VSKDKVAKKIQRKAKRRVERKLPVQDNEVATPEEVKTFDPVKDSPGGE